MHGYVGALGHNAGVRASPGDLLSHLDIGPMGTLQAQKGHVVLPVDIMWLALSDDKRPRSSVQFQIDRTSIAARDKPLGLEAVCIYSSHDRSLRCG